MAITRWDPFREVVALQNRVNSLFRDLNDGDDPVAAASFVPAVDIYEDARRSCSSSKCRASKRRIWTCAWKTTR